MCFQKFHILHILDAATESPPKNIYEAIQQINRRIQNIEDQIQIGRAHTANVRVLIHNTWLQSPHVFQPLQKTVCLIVPATSTPDFIQRRSQPGARIRS